jgi:hypothetical protein
MKEGLLDTQVFTPAYQNPDRRGRARITRSYKDDQDERRSGSLFFRTLLVQRLGFPQWKMQFQQLFFYGGSENRGRELKTD